AAHALVAAEHIGRAVRFEFEHAGETGFQCFAVAVAFACQIAYQRQRLEHARQRQDARLPHATPPIRGASVLSITAPPRHSSPAYNNTYCPGATARCVASK